MNKAELVEAIAKETGSSKAQTEKGLNAALNVIKKALKKGESVTLIGFGTLTVKKRAKRNGINPQTKKKIVIPAKNVPVFRPGKELKEAVK